MSFKYNPFTGTLDLVGSSGGGGTTTYSYQVTVDFGFPSGNEGDLASTTVSASWVQSNSVIVCNAFSGATPDHDPSDVVVEDIQAYATNIIPGVSFDVIALAPQNSWGRYLINILGM